MGPKAEAAAWFAEATGGYAAIGALTDARAVLEGARGTSVAARAGVRRSLLALSALVGV